MSRARDNANLGAQAGSGLDASDITTGVLPSGVTGGSGLNALSASSGALLDSELTSITNVKALNQSVISGATPTFTTTNFTDASNKRLMTDAQETILDSVESSATADQSASEIKTLLENGIDSVHYVNASIDNEHLADDAVGSDELANNVVIDTSGAITSSAGITETGGALKENLLTNSGFDVWSNSTLENTGSDKVTNGTFTSNTSGWTGYEMTLASVSGGQSGNRMRLTKTVANWYGSGYQSITGLTIGKMYKLSVYADRGTAGSVLIGLGLEIYGVPSYFYVNCSHTDITQLHTFIWEATVTSANLVVSVQSGSVDAVSYIDTVSFYEVTPGCVAADTNAPDGWKKHAPEPDVSREYTGTNTKDGSFYALKYVSAGTADQWSRLVKKSSDSTLPRIENLQGRTLTLGAWVWADTGSTARLLIRDGSTFYYSDPHTGGSSYEWLEVTRAVGSSSTGIEAGLNVYVASKTVYISQPMLVFGNSIGSGNYTRPQGEWVYYIALRCGHNDTERVWSESGRKSNNYR